ncbi:MAG: CAP domain-containing protein [Pseudomonadota bacterium]
MLSRLSGMHFCATMIGVVASIAAVGVAAPVGETQSPSPVTVISREQLEHVPTNRSVGELLRNCPARTIPTMAKPPQMELNGALPAQLNCVQPDDLRMIDIYRAHNKERALLGYQPLRWNAALEMSATLRAQQLAHIQQLIHAPREGRGIERENLLSAPIGWSPEQMMDRWISEKRYFHPGTFPEVCSGDWSQCVHYTQMIWRTTTDIGCGIAPGGGFNWLVCRYSPGGNKDGVAIGETARIGERADGPCAEPGGNTIPCGNPPDGPKIAGQGNAGGEVQDGGSGGTEAQDGGGQKDDAAKDETSCVVDVNLHRPISIDPDEPVIADATELNPGATTLRNDDSDWHLGREAGTGALPVISLPTDITRMTNADENDLVKVEAVNAAGLPNVYLFAFPTDAEANSDLGTQVQPVAGGRTATPQELGYFTSAAKAAAAPGLPLAVPAAGLSFWTEAKLGGKYRMVIGQLVPGLAAAGVRYNRAKGEAYYMADKKPMPAFLCEDQATLTAAVVDIFQRGNRSSGPQRLTAFDVYWAGRPHFRAEVWPGGQAYSWGEQYRLGATLHAMPGNAVGTMVASMARDAEDVHGDANAKQDGPTVPAKGKAPGNLGLKGRIEGGFQIDSPQQGNVPTVITAADDRYPDRVSLDYLVNGEHLVRSEYLQVLLPRIRPPAASAAPEAGTINHVESKVNYTIVDAFDRVIKAETIPDYLYFYGAGLKAWEALEGQAGKVVESGPRNRPDPYNDYLFITNTGFNPNGVQRDPAGPLGTAQRSQMEVLANRMTEGVFKDRLEFNAPTDVNAREALWRAASGRDGATDALRRGPLKRARDEATVRDKSVRDGNSVADADRRRIASFTVLSIPQDVILQLRMGTERKDLMVFQGNRLSIFAPYFFEDTQYPGNKDDEVFRYHVEFQPGAPTSQLVGVGHRRP